MEIVRRADAVNTREDFVAFVQALREDLAKPEEPWVNTTLDDYLEALGGFAEDMGPPLDAVVSETEHDYSEPVPNWNLFARMILMAAIYE